MSRKSHVSHFRLGFTSCLLPVSFLLPVSSCGCNLQNMATSWSSSIDGETLEKAKRELNEDPETREQAINDMIKAIEEKESEKRERERGSEFILYLHVHSKNSPKIQMIQNLKVLFLKEKTLSFSYIYIYSYGCAIILLGRSWTSSKKMNRFAASVLLTLLLVSVSWNDIRQPQFATTKPYLHCNMAKYFILFTFIAVSFLLLKLRFKNKSCTLQEPN